MKKTRMSLNTRAAEPKIAIVLGIFLMALSTLVLVGWWLGFFTITFLIDGLPSMKANTALGVFTLGITLISMTKPRHHLKVLLGGVFLILLSGLTLAQSIFGLNLGIDQAIALDRISTEYPGRMSIATAATFLGCGLLILGSNKGPRQLPFLFDTLFVLTAFLPMTALMAYIYSPKALFSVQVFSTMAIHTAVGFLLFLMGFAWLIADQSLLRFFALSRLREKNLRYTYVALILLPLVIGWVIEQMVIFNIINAPFAITLSATGFVITIILFMARITSIKESSKKKLRQEAKRRISRERRLLDLLDQSYDAVLMFGPNQEVLHANWGAELLFGWSVNELKSFKLPDLIPHRYRERHVSHVSKFHQAEDQGTVNDNLLNMIALHKDGYDIPVTITVSKKKVDGLFYFTAIVRDARRIMKNIKKMREAAFVDPLTQVGNRRALDQILENYRGGQRKTDQTAILMIDLDHFKAINDTYGHDCGDDVLRQSVQCIGDCLREADHVYRYGGEEFVVVLENVSMNTALTLSERFRCSVADLKLTLNKKNVSITLSVGVALLKPSDNGLEDTLKRADKAMYGAKREGRNKVICAD